MSSVDSDSSSGGGDQQQLQQQQLPRPPSRETMSAKASVASKASVTSIDGGGSRQRTFTAKVAPTSPRVKAAERHRPDKVRRKGSEWEILGSLEKDEDYAIVPRKHEGFLSKKRKSPLKGWHKR